MTGLQNALRYACEELGLQVEFDQIFEFGDHLRIHVPARIVSLGSPMGMLVFQDVATVWPIRAAIRSAGYGYSVLEDRPIDRVVDIESFKRVFTDWGWSGDPAMQPSWFEQACPDTGAS